MFPRCFGTIRAGFTLANEENAAIAPHALNGCGPRIAPFSDTTRPLRQQIFERVRAAGTMPRIQVAKELGVSPASVTTLTSTLIDEGLLHEIAVARETADAARGRPPVALGVRPEAAFVAGIKLSDREHTGVLLDFSGGRLAEHVLPAQRATQSVAELLEVTSGLLDALCDEAGVTRDRLSALGVGIPGFVENASGRVHWSPILTERDVDFAERAARTLGLPVTIDNDANLVALAELWFGAGRDRSDFAVVTIEHGVGMGLVLNHRLYRGAQGLGMELGHIKVQLDGALCRCGQRGCLEAYVADYALAREATTALNWLDKDTRAMRVLLESLYDHAKAGNAQARTIFRRAGRYLAVGLATVVNILDPALIILSGERMRFDYLYADDTLGEMENLTINTGRALPPIEVRAWGDMLWANGAAALALALVTETRLGAARDMAAQ